MRGWFVLRFQWVSKVSDAESLAARNSLWGYVEGNRSHDSTC
jgi:hypothetical protein